MLTSARWSWRRRRSSSTTVPPPPRVAVTLGVKPRAPNAAAFELVTVRLESVPESSVIAPAATVEEAHNNLMLTKALDLSARRKAPVKLPLDPDEEKRIT